MGLTKSENFTAGQNEIARIAKALAHPARVAILQHLMKLDRCICGDLVDEIELSQPTISQHLNKLKEVDLLKGNIEGTSVCYCINQKKWKEVEAVLTSFLDYEPGDQIECC